MISALRENRYRPNLFPDDALCQNNTSYIKPVRANALVLYYQRMSRHQPEKRKKMFRPYFEYKMKEGKCEVVPFSTPVCAYDQT